MVCFHKAGCLKRHTTLVPKVRFHRYEVLEIDGYLYKKIKLKLIALQQILTTFIRQKIKNHKKVYNRFAQISKGSAPINQLSKPRNFVNPR